MSLSGGDSLEAREKIRNGMLERYPELSRDYDVCCDTVGAIATACENGQYNRSTLGRDMGIFSFLQISHTIDQREILFSHNNFKDLP